MIQLHPEYLIFRTSQGELLSDVSGNVAGLSSTIACGSTSYSSTIAARTARITGARSPRRCSRLT